MYGPVIERFHRRLKLTYWCMNCGWALMRIWLTATLLAAFRVCTEGLTATVHYAVFVNV